MGVAAPLIMAAGSSSAAPTIDTTPKPDPRPDWIIQAAPKGHIGDFDRVLGHWHVKHHQLVGRLVGSTTWIDFDGTSRMELMLGGYATVDDNELHKPAGTYQGITLRLFDSQHSTWSIYWFDSREVKVDSPMWGGFDGDHGVFLGDDILDGKPIRVRFDWFIDDKDHARWEQAFSADQGASWETNWRMWFARA
jgi:hypothetical protein